MRNWELTSKLGFLLGEHRPEDHRRASLVYDPCWGKLDYLYLLKGTWAELTTQYASYPTTDIRHILPLLVPAFAQAVSQKPKKAHGDSFAEKIKADRVEVPLSEPKGQEIKHDWFWGRMGKFFQNDGEWRQSCPSRGWDIN
jgi:hypothetical protein